jgi:large subunit ribosomal protein L10
MTRREKEAIVADLAGTLTGSRSVVLADFTGLCVEEMNRLRRSLKERSVEIRVVKNTLARFAVRQAGLGELLPFLEGPTALVTSEDDPLEPTKALMDFARKKEKPKIKGVLLEGEIGGLHLAERIKDLPPRGVLLGMLLSAMGSPIAGLTGALRGIICKLIWVLLAIQSQKEGKNG